MIEFKADCGHTIRAKDEDEGKVVRCSYCGREAQVPSNAPEQDLDFVLGEVEQTGVFDQRATRTERKARRRKTGRPRTTTPFNPFAVALKMGYAALILIVFIYVGKTYVLPAVEGLRSGQPEQPNQSTATPQRDRSGRGRNKTKKTEEPPAPRRGLLAKKLPPQRSGIYVDSLPPHARIYVREAGTATGSILLDTSRRVTRERASAALQMVPGTYEVAVVLPLNDPGLKEFRDAGYDEFRRNLESSEDNRLVEEFFLPDSARHVYAQRVLGQHLVVRSYEIRVMPRTWSGVIALFLPDVPPSKIVGHLPRRPMFGFDEANAADELGHYGVATDEHRPILETLTKLGVITYYRESDGKYLQFWIDLTTGDFNQRTLKVEKRRAPQVGATTS